MKRYYFAIILVIILLGSLALLPLFEQKDLHEVFIAIFTSAAFGLLIEISVLLRDKFHLGYLSGTYRRLKFYNRNDKTTDSGYNDETTDYKQQNINEIIELSYHGQGEYRGVAHYPRGEKKFTLNINPNNILSGSGIYQYTTKEKDNITPDIGLFSFIVDMDRRTIYIEHENKLPSGNARGIEVWRR
jgi:hypothetical protein